MIERWYSSHNLRAAVVQAGFDTPSSQQDWPYFLGPSLLSGQAKAQSIHLITQREPEES